MTRNKEEFSIQKAVVRWFRLQYPQHSNSFTSSLAGVNVGPIKGKELKEMGLLAGYVDLCFDIPSQYYHGLRLELKRPGGQVQRNQRDVHHSLLKNGYAVRVCKSFDACRITIVDYLSDKIIDYKDMK